MIRSKDEMILSPEILKAFAGVRDRIKKIVNSQNLVSLQEALAQVKRGNEK